MNRQIRELEENIEKVLNASAVPMECKRIILENCMIKCEIRANEHISQESITEEGEMENVTELE